MKNYLYILCAFLLAFAGCTNGVVLRYSPDGELLDEFYVGIIPGAFCWR